MYATFTAERHCRLHRNTESPNTDQQLLAHPAITDQTGAMRSGTARPTGMPMDYPSKVMQKLTSFARFGLAVLKLFSFRTQTCGRLDTQSNIIYPIRTACSPPRKQNCHIAGSISPSCSSAR